MSDEKKFMEMLYDLVALARVNDNCITTNEVDEFFEEMSLDEKQKDAVYDYLCKGHIKVIGYTTVSDNTVSEDAAPENTVPDNSAFASGVMSDKSVPDSSRTKHYRKTVKEMAASDTDFKKVYERVVSGGGDEAAELIIHAYLPTVINISTKYAGRGVLSDELIQEGNLALILAAKNIASGADGSVLKSFRSFDGYIRDSIRTGMTELIDSEIGREGELQVVIGKAQLVKDAASYLSKELGRVASVRELSEYTHIPDEEIQDIIRFSGNVLPSGDGE